MKFPLSTGHAARLLATSEPRLNRLIRNGQITPPPEVVAGRRLWQTTHLLQAAEHLGLQIAELRAALGRVEEVSAHG